MVRIKGYGFTRKDKVFAEFETPSGKYLFKESHSSEKGNYRVGIFNPSGNKIQTITMDREQINRIKEGKGIANIDFYGEEGFINYLKNQYDKDFDEEKFKNFFRDHFVSAYEDINNSDFYYTQTEDGKTVKVSGSFDEFYAEYMAYLVEKTPSFILENIYYDNPKYFRKVFKYNDDELTVDYLHSPEKMYGSKYKYLEGAKAQILQGLNSYGVDYLSYDEFVNSGLYESYKSTKYGK